MPWRAEENMWVWGWRSELGPRRVASQLPAPGYLASPHPTPDGQRDFRTKSPCGHRQSCLQGPTEILESWGQGAVGVRGNHTAHIGQIWAENRGISSCPLKQVPGKRFLKP